MQKSNNEELISIIVPVYNVEKWLSRCVNSILGQTYTNFELILVNDGSTDSSYKICKDYLKKDNRIKLIDKKNGGLSEARNFGISNAKGKYIIFIDSDDYINKNYIAILYKAIVTNNSDIAICEYNEVAENGDFLKEVSLNEPENENVVTGKEVIRYLLKNNGTANIVAWNKIYKRELFNNIRYQVGKFYEDEYIVVPLMWNIERICLIRKPLYNYVQRSGSIMLSPFTLKKVKDIDSFRQKRINFFKTKKNKEFYFLAVDSYKNWILLLMQTNFNNKEYINYLQKQYRRYALIYYPRSVKKIVKDIVGSINIRLAAKLKG